MTTEAKFPRGRSVLSLLSMAAFHLIIYGRFWVITKEVIAPPMRTGSRTTSSQRPRSLSLRPDQIHDGIDFLEGREVLIRVGDKLRLVPDLFADYLLEMASIHLNTPETVIKIAHIAIFKDGFCILYSAKLPDHGVVEKPQSASCAKS
jgi:hypothetical protein